MRYHKDAFVSIIKKSDYRYAMMDDIVNTRLSIIKRAHVHKNNEIYFECWLEGKPGVGLYYDHNWSKQNEFEICYVDFRKKLEQIRTIYR